MRGFIHLILAFVLGIFILPIGFIYSIAKYIFDCTNKYTYGIAYQINLLGCYTAATLFNDIFIKKDADMYYKFGTLNKSISYCIGKNYEFGTLSKFGHLVNMILNIIEENHTIKAVQKEENG